MGFKDLKLDGYAKSVYGKNAKAIATSDHLYGWKIEVDGKSYGINMDEAAKWSHGSNYISVATGVHKYDWCAFNIDENKDIIVPIMVVAKDKWQDIEDVKKASVNVLGGLTATKKWYEKNTRQGSTAGKSFDFLDKVIVFNASQKGTEWNDFAKATDIPDTTTPDPYPSEPNREILDLRLQPYLKSRFKDIHKHKVIFLTVPYTGLGSNASGAGALCRGNFVTQPPSIAEINADTTTDTTKRDMIIYSIGHELGHAFGLPHSCDLYAKPDCYDSIMQNPTNNFSVAKLLSQEITQLFASPYFR
jgi:hypothetical protein